MKAKRFFALTTAVAMSATMLTGCGSKTAQSKPQAKSKSAVSTEKTSENGPSWKKDTSDCTITWFFAYDWYDKKFNKDINAFDKKMYEDTGCKLDIQTGNIDKLNMLIKTDKLPDVVTLDANSTQRELLEDNGKVLPLDELQAKYAPDLIVPKSMKDWYRNADGHWYSIASYYYGEDNVKANNGFFETHNQNYVRDDILKEIGMNYDDLRTKEGFLKALRAVKNKNITYKGVKVIPFVALFAGGEEEKLAEQFGGSFETPDGKFQSMYRTKAFREAMMFYNQLYREGLLTDISLTANKTQVQQEVAAGHVFATIAKTNASAVKDSLYAQDHNAKMMYAGQFTGDNNKKIMVPANNNMGWTATLINKNAKHPERVIRLISYLTQKDNVLNNYCGVGSWKLDKDGKVMIEPERRKMQETNPKEYVLKYVGNFGWTCDYTIIQGTRPRDDGSVWAEDTYLQTHDNRITIYDDKTFSDVAPKAGSKEAAIAARIDEYKTHAVGKIVTASTAEKAEKELNTMLAEMDKLGLKELDKYKDKRFQANKKKLGIKFAFPGNEQNPT